MPPAAASEDALTPGGGAAGKQRKGNIGAETVTSKFKSQVRRADMYRSTLGSRGKVMYMTHAHMCCYLRGVCVSAG